MKTATAFAFVTLAICRASTVSAVTIDMVTVGNAGNAPDTRYDFNLIGFGSVGYEYQIGKYEVTADQYTEFLNAVAKAEPKRLYNTSMADPVGALGANIQRTGSSPNYSYSVAADWANRPVNWVSFWDAARFANWLHNGQPTGPQGPGTTESGAYHDVGNQTLFGRNPGARYFIPTEDEWYKAAYHDKAAGLAATYFDFPTGTSDVPNNANYAINGHYIFGSPYYRTEVGAFTNAASPYGTFDQGGNVEEWNEKVFSSTLRSVRGGSFDSYSDNLFASNSDGKNPEFEYRYYGFRVASSGIPEPGNFTLCVFGVMIFALRSRKR